MEGTIVRIISNLCTVDCNGTLYDCKPRGKFYHTNISPLVGDHVVIDEVNNYILDIKMQREHWLQPQEDLRLSTTTPWAT